MIHFLCGPVLFLRAISVQSLLEGLTPGQKTALIIGGVVAGVTGMWIALYQRGKK